MDMDLHDDSNRTLTHILAWFFIFLKYLWQIKSSNYSSEKMPEQLRKIIHIDMDCFFAAIEMRENPQLQGKPIAVGGHPESRSVVATCSYEARKFGIHSAMPMSIAVRKCPNLICLPVHMDLYKRVSKSIQKIFHEYTDLVEPLSLDEAFLDVSNARHCKGSATLIAQEILERISQSQSLTASAGVAPNKFLAKIASDWQKPNGLTVIKPNQVNQFIKDVPVKRIFGVGKVTAIKMTALNIESCGDLQELSPEELEQQFGSFGHRLYELSRGIDNHPVKTHRIRKSLSVEDTFAKDLPSIETCIQQIPRLYNELMRRFQKSKLQQKLIPKTLFVKMRFYDFSTTTLQMTGSQTSTEAYQYLCQEIWQRGNKPVRLIGIGMQFQKQNQPEQLEIF